MDTVPSQSEDAYIMGVEEPRKKEGLAIYRQIIRRWDPKHENGLRHEGDEQAWEDMKEDFLLKAVPAGIPDPSNEKQFLAKVESFFGCGYTASFVECLARRENQHWHIDTREKVAKLEQLFRKVAEWNASWEQKLSRFCRDATCYHDPKCFGYDRGCQYPIGFADFEKDPGQWQLDVERCFNFGFNVRFVEDIAKRQDKLWTQQMRFSAQQLEREFHRPALVQKYKEGKSTQTITEEMLEETGLKLSSRTLNEQFRKWRVPKGTCSPSKPKVPAEILYTNMSCHPRDTWHAVEEPFPLHLIQLNPCLSSQGPNLDTVGITNSAHSVSVVPINQHTQDTVQTQISSINTEMPYVSTMHRLGSGPADWDGSFIDYPAETVNYLPIELARVNQRNTNVTGSLDIRPSLASPLSMSTSNKGSGPSTVPATREYPHLLNTGQHRWWGESKSLQEAMGISLPSLSDYDMDIDDRGTNAEVARQSRIMRLWSEWHATADRHAALDLELKAELRKSGYSDDSGYFSNSASVASSLGSKRRRVMDLANNAQSLS